MNRLVWCTLAASIVVLVAVPVSVLASRPDSQVGSLEALRRSDVHVSAQTQVPGLALPKVRIRSGLLAREVIRRVGEIPERLRIAAIGVDAPVFPVGVTAGTTEIPPDVHDVGWYRFGGRPGGSGSTLLVAHVSSGTQGAGVFIHLRDLMPGDDIVVQMRDGSSSTFGVIARRSFAKDALPDRLFSRTGPSMLALVTCGGPYDEATGRYEDNIVVYAVPGG